MENCGLSAREKEKQMKILADYRDNTLRKKPVLKTLFLELTGDCNLHCLHCGSHCGDFVPEDTLSTAEITSFLDAIRKDYPIDKMMLAITGGEPLLRKDFFEITAYAKCMGYRWGMTTNGTLITPEIAEKLVLTGLRTVSVSIDGSKSSHDRFRQKEGCFEKAVEGVANLLKASKMPGSVLSHVQITTVVNSMNYDELDEMYEFFSTLGVRSWRVINIEPIGRAAEMPELLLTKEQYKGLFDFIRRKRFAGPMEVVYGCSHFLGTETEKEVRNWYFLCSAGVTTAGIMHNGDIGACLDIERRPELIQGNIRKDNFKEVWENKFVPFRSDFRKKGPCAKCDKYKFCAGDSFHTWNFDENRPNLCMKGILF